jgi:hypothetical protein
MLALAPWVVALSLGQSSDPYVRSRVTPGDASTQCLYWTQNRIAWQQSSVGNQKMTSHTEFKAISNSFQSWQDIFSACGNLSFAEGPVVDDRKVGYVRDGTNRNLVLFRTRRCADVVASTDACFKDETCANAYDCWEDNDGTIAITLTTYDERSGIIYDSDISFNAARFDFTTVDSPPCGGIITQNCVATDVQNTATHEIGHFVGLDHTRAAGSTMNPSAPPGETSKRSIDPGSRDFVCTTYPKGSASQACIHPVADAALGSKGSGCTSAAGGLAALPLLAASSLLLARRRRGGAR